MQDDEGTALTADNLARFVESCRGEHDRDPADWHRKMLEPPRARSTECAFCGLPWPAAES